MNSGGTERERNECIQSMNERMIDTARRLGLLDGRAS
jgi:hypothetical protein